MPELSLPEWIVLTLVDEQPRHGFAVAALTAPDGPVGAVWTVGRPVVYRAAGRLVELGLAEIVGTEPGSRGPQRSLFAAGVVGRAAVQAWLGEPVGHVRDVRAEFLVKLALLDRRGADPQALVRAQRARLAPLAAGVRARVDEVAGFERTLATWRAENFAATLRFLDELAG